MVLPTFAKNCQIFITGLKNQPHTQTCRMLKMSQNDQETTKCIYYSIYSTGSSTHLAYSFSRFFNLSKIIFMFGQWNTHFGKSILKSLLCVCVYDICFFPDTVTICLSTWLSFSLHYNIFNLLIIDLIFYLTFSSFSLFHSTTLLFSLTQLSLLFYYLSQIIPLSTPVCHSFIFFFSPSFSLSHLWFLFFFGEKLISLFTLSFFSLSDFIEKWII